MKTWNYMPTFFNWESLYKHPDFWLPLKKLGQSSTMGQQLLSGQSGSGLPQKQGSYHSSVSAWPPVSGTCCEHWDPHAVSPHYICGDLPGPAFCPLVSSSSQSFLPRTLNYLPFLLMAPKTSLGTLGSLHLDYWFLTGTNPCPRGHLSHLKKMCLVN